MEKSFRFCTRVTSFLSAKTSQVNQIALKHRAPPRYFGRTKAQILDTLVKNNAMLWGGLTVITIPSVFYLLYKVDTQVLPEKNAEIAQKEEELLSEGRYQKQ